MNLLELVKPLFFKYNASVLTDQRSVDVERLFQPLRVCSNPNISFVTRRRYALEWSATRTSPANHTCVSGLQNCERVDVNHALF